MHALSVLNAGSICYPRGSLLIAGHTHPGAVGGHRVVPKNLRTYLISPNFDSRSLKVWRIMPCVCPYRSIIKRNDYQYVLSCVWSSVPNFRSRCPLEAAVDVLLTSRVSRAVLLALLLVFIDRWDQYDTIRVQRSGVTDSV